MLKIKDNVDLKELEKYGFKLYKCKSIDNYKWYEKIIEYDFNKKVYYYVNIDNRTMEISIYDGYDNKLDNTLYDLIKADLVEKIDD
jgi:hypothetical protein